MKKITAICALVSIVGIASTTVMADSKKMKDYRITITNATTHHVITPPIIVIHKKGFKLFEVTESASYGLATMAETGNNQPLLSEVEDVNSVVDVIAGSAPIVYGNKISYEFSAPKNSMLSFAAMLATTNDAFASVSAVALPKDSVSYMATTYDAGSESNNESCKFIPGPPCSATSGNLRSTADAEGFVSIHKGIRGGNGLNATELDWRGATAIVTITRIDD